MKRVLTVRFVTGDDMLAGKVSKITLKNVYGTGKLPLRALPAWYDLGGATNFEQTLSPEVVASDPQAPDTPLTPEAATFMMLPQTAHRGADRGEVYRQADEHAAEPHGGHIGKVADGEDGCLPHQHEQHRGEVYTDGDACHDRIQLQRQRMENLHRDVCFRVGRREHGRPCPWLGRRSSPKTEEYVERKSACMAHGLYQRRQRRHFGSFLRR